jgi:hypothetical protein
MLNILGQRVIWLIILGLLLSLIELLTQLLIDLLIYSVKGHVQFASTNLRRLSMSIFVVL